MPPKCNPTPKGTTNPWGDLTTTLAFPLLESADGLLQGWETGKLLKKIPHSDFFGVFIQQCHVKGKKTRTTSQTLGSCETPAQAWHQSPIHSSLPKRLYTLGASGVLRFKASWEDRAGGQKIHNLYTNAEQKEEIWPTGHQQQSRKLPTHTFVNAKLWYWLLVLDWPLSHKPDTTNEQ